MLFLLLTSFFIILGIANTSQAREITQVPHWQKKVINVYIPKDGDKKTISMIKSAFAKWQSVSAGHISFTYVEKAPGDIDIIFKDAASSSSGPISKTSVVTSGNSITKAEITIATDDKQYKKYPDKYVSTILLHEVGRSLGLPTNDRKPSSIMHTPVTEKQNLMKMDTVKLFSISEWNYSKRRLEENKDKDKDK